MRKYTLWIGGDRSFSKHPPEASRDNKIPAFWAGMDIGRREEQRTSLRCAVDAAALMALKNAQKSLGGLRRKRLRSWRGIVRSNARHIRSLLLYTGLWDQCSDQDLPELSKLLLLKHRRKRRDQLFLAFRAHLRHSTLLSH